MSSPRRRRSRKSRITPRGKSKSKLRQKNWFSMSRKQSWGSSESRSRSGSGSGKDVILEEGSFVQSIPKFHRTTYTSNIPYPLSSIHAHIIFYTSNAVLLGYHRYGQTRGHFGGLGGAVERGDDYIFYTAIRELLEELFLWENIDQDVINVAIDSCPDTVEYTKTSSKKTLQFMIYMNMKILEDILRSLSKLRISSPLYEKFPKTVVELVQNRLTKPISPHSKSLPEIGQLKLVSRKSSSFKKDSAIADYTKDDISALNQSLH